MLLNVLCDRNESYEGWTETGHQCFCRDTGCTHFAECLTLKHTSCQQVTETALYLQSWALKATRRSCTILEYWLCISVIFDHHLPRSKQQVSHQTLYNRLQKLKIDCRQRYNFHHTHCLHQMSEKYGSKCSPNSSISPFILLISKCHQMDNHMQELRWHKQKTDKFPCLFPCSQLFLKLTQHMVSVTE